MKHRILYLPIETKAREFLGKVLLSVKAVERGWMVVIGEMNQVASELYGHPPGAYLEISIPEKKARNLEAFQAHGHRTVNLCEENIVYIDGKDYCDRKVGPTSMAATDLLFTCGERNERHLRQHRPEGAHKIRLVGNPRFDTLRPELREVYESEAQPIRRRFGRFLLVNTNFAYVNNHFKPGKDYVYMLSRRGMIVDEDHAAFKRRECARKGEQLEGFKSMLIQLGRSGAYDRIIVRPHPSENHDFWSWAGEHGLEVCYEGNANSWILAAEALLHPGCTTGIESLLLDRPAASYVPDPGSEFLNQADEVSKHVTDANGFLEYSSQFRDVSQETLREMLAPQRKILSEYICNVDKPMSVDRIIESLEELDVPEVTRKQAGFGFSTRVRENAAHHYELLKDKARDIVYKRPHRAANFRRQKFPSLTTEDFSRPIDTWCETGVLKQKPWIKKIRDQLFILSGQA